ncbi:hypothetical protein HC891_03160 [Candidatus Gracilibacteria bacterium]|nr:hypothetical protein [Candidatus Gracilibacteria bacterium]
MTYRQKLVMGMILFLLTFVTGIVLVWPQFSLQLESYIGIITGLAVATHLCLYANATWDPARLQTITPTKVHPLLRDQVVGSSFILGIIGVPIAAAVFQLDWNAIMGVASVIVTLILFSYVIVRVAIKK